MEQSRFPQIFSVIALAIAAFCAWFIIRSNDHLRWEVEKLRAEIRQLKDLPGTPRGERAPAPEPVKGTGMVANLDKYDPDRVSGDRLITATSADSLNMNEILACDASVSGIWELAGCALAERSFDHLDKWEPMLAEKWEILDNGLRFRITLRKGVLWHDFTDPVTGKRHENKELTAHDFKFYVDTVKNPGVDCAPLRVYLNDLEKVEVRSDYEFDVVWKKRYFLSEEITLALTPLPRHLYHAYPGPFDPEKFNSDDARNRMIVGVGPYRFERWDKGKRMVLRRWEKFFGNNLGIRPAIETIVIEVIKHPGTRLQSAVAGELDECSLTPDQWINRTGIPAFAPKTGTLRKISHPSPVYNYIGFNLKKSIFADSETRRALSLLVNRERILKEIYFGLARPVTGPFFPDAPANDSSIPIREFSISRAVEMLHHAGWKEGNDGIMVRNGERLEFNLMYPSSNPIYGRMLPLISQDMIRAGVKMKPLGLEWTVCLQRLDQKKFDACAMGWSGGINPDPYQLWHSSQADLEASSNFVGFKNKEADELIEKIRVTFDPAERQKLYHRFHRLIYEEAPYIFLFSPYSLNALSARYRNVKVYPLGYYTKTFWSPKAQQRHWE